MSFSFLHSISFSSASLRALSQEQARSRPTRGQAKSHAKRWRCSRHALFSPYKFWFNFRVSHPFLTNLHLSRLGASGGFKFAEASDGLPSPSRPGTKDGDWRLGLDEATALDNAQAVSDYVFRDSARRRRRRRRHSNTNANAVAVAAPAGAAAAAGQRQPDRVGSADSAQQSK